MKSFFYSHLNEDLILEESDIQYFENIIVILERKFGTGLLHKGKDDFNPDEEMFVNSLSKAVNDLGGGVPKEKVGVFKKVLMSLLVPLVGVHVGFKLTPNISADDIAYTLSKFDISKVEQFSNRLKEFIAIAKTKKKNKNL